MNDREPARVHEALPADLRELVARIGARQKGPPPESPEVLCDRRRRALVTAGVPSEIVEVAVAPSVTITPAIEALGIELAAGARMVVLAGGVGVGKSVAAAHWLSLALQAHDERCWMRWVHAHHLARMGGHEHGDQITELEKVDFLVLDDLGVEYLDQRGWLSAMLDSIVCQRHGARRATVVTTNLLAEQFRLRYGERVADRLRECGSFVQIAGESLRKATTARCGDE